MNRSGDAALRPRAVAASSEWAFDSYKVVRIFATVFAHNAASIRVLEKSGFTREGILRRSAIKNGEILDQVMYAKSVTIKPQGRSRLPASIATWRRSSIIRNLTIEFATAQGTGDRRSRCQLSHRCRRGLRAGRRVGLRQVGELAGDLAPASAPGAHSRSIRFRGQDMLAACQQEMRHIRGAGISMIFQEPMTALNPVMRVGDQIAEAVLAHSGNGNGRVSKAEAWSRAVEALRTVAVADADRRARELSPPAFRRPAPARDDRHGRGESPVAADCR